jgi:hypothetical protein
MPPDAISVSAVSQRDFGLLPAIVGALKVQSGARGHAPTQEGQGLSPVMIEPGPALLQLLYLAGFGRGRARFEKVASRQAARVPAAPSRR